MKKIFFIITILFITIALNSQGVYYVAIDGDDNDAGTIGEPWATWEKAFETATTPGDSVYFRGGVYYLTSTQNNYSGPSGTYSNPIVFTAYPGEVPILDGSNKTSASAGIVFHYADYIVLKGLVVRNHFQFEGDGQNDYVYGIYLYTCGNVTIENCSVYNIGRRGFFITGTDTLYVNNCDAYNIADTLDI